MESLNMVDKGEGERPSGQAEKAEAARSAGGPGGREEERGSQRNIMRTGAHGHFTSCTKNKKNSLACARDLLAKTERPVSRTTD